MRLTYDPRYNIAYIRFQEKLAEVETIQVSDELIVDVAPDGTIYGIELLNANEQLGREDRGRLLVVNEATGVQAELPLWELQDEKMTQAEEEMGEQAPTVQAEIREARTAYQAGDYMTIEETILDQLERQVAQLPRQEQLKLLNELGERLTKAVSPPAPSTKKERAHEAAAILRECDRAAAAFTRKTDSAETIRRMREQRQRQL